MKWTGSAGDYKQPPTGTHLARCIGVIDLGTQKSEYQGQANIRRQVILRWELPTELIEDGEAAGKPYICSKFYTASLNEKSRLYADLVNWRGKEFSPEELKGFDAKNVLDKTCMVSLTENDQGKARVTGIMKGPKHMECPPRVNDLVYFSLEPGEFKREDFDALPEGFQKIIKLSPEYAELNGAASGSHARKGSDELADDIPF
jgi:hypothetical protein